MDVVLNSHIALLVLGYLYEEKLDNVSKYFCKFSPYLDEEYQIIKKGLRPIMINSNSLSTVVREHCYIKSKVNEIISTFPRNIKVAFDRQTLSGKINHLLKIVKKTICTNEVENPLKRNRTEALSPSEKSSCTNTTQVETLPGYCPEKKRKIADSYMFIGNDFSEESESETEDETSDEEPTVHTAFADRILENKPFQNKLLQNINKALEVNSSNRNNHENNLLSNSNNCEDLNKLDEIIQDVISATEKEPSFDEVINNVMTCINNKKGVQKSSEKILNELCIDNTANLHSIQTQTSQFSHVEKVNANSDLNETPSDNECNAPQPNNDIDINYSSSKILLMNSTDFMSASQQTLSPFKNDQILFDLNGVQTFPVLMGADGAMYINSNIMQSDVRQVGNIRADNFNLTQRNVGNVQVLNTESIFEEFQDRNINLNENENAITTEKKNTAGNKNISSPKKSTLAENKNSPKVSSVECKESKDKRTPEHNISFANISLNKSLSTPRRKTSHVKVLNFSPLKSFRILNNKITCFNKSDNNSISPTIIEKPNSKTTVNLNPNSVVADNESSNSTDPTGDRSNITVIQRIASSNNDTPKRKTNLISCKRNLSRSNSEETVKTEVKDVLKETDNSNKVVKESSNKIKGNNAKQSVTKKTIGLSNNKNVEKPKVAVDAMEEWKQLREKSKNSNFDQFLREIHSKTPLADAHITKRRKLRRKIGTKLKKGLKSISPLNSSKKQNEEVNDAKISQNIEIEDKIESILIEREDKTNKKVPHEKKSKSIETKTNFLNFRIKTPIKLNYRDPKTIVVKRVSKNSKNKSSRVKEVYDTGKQPICIETSIDAADQPNSDNIKINEQIFNFKTQDEGNIAQDLERENNNTVENSISQKFCEEREKRTANIAHILDTPFKLDENNLVPTTPGFLFSNCLPINDTITPMAKLTFSSLCNTKNIDITTPAFAITPGGHLNCSTDKETPKSAVITDYSSGGSYYRPDDAIDINKKLDRELNAKFDKKHLHETENKLSKILLNSEISTIDDQNKPLDAVVTEIIPCPVVLEKVKSFSEEIPDVVPHYKFIEAGLPDITDESTSSSSSSSDESTSSSSSSSSPVQTPVTKDITVKEKTEPLSLLSNIDSSEDEEWEIQSSSKNKILMEENSQLVSNDGEVRFPVRSWITPKKNDAITLELTSEQSCQFSLQDMSCIDVDISINQVKSACDRELNKKNELSEKLKRVKAKLNQSKLESNGKVTNKKFKSTKIISPPNIKEETSEKPSIKIRTSNSQSEVLAALNLSAKKKNTVENNTINNIELPEISKEKSRCSQVDDNATTELFTLRMEEESNDSLEVRNAALTLTKMKTNRMGEFNTSNISKLNVETKKRFPKKIEIEETNIKDKNKTRSFINKNKCELKKSNSVKLKKNLKENEKKLLRKCNSKSITEVSPKEIKNEGSMQSKNFLKDGDNLIKNLSADELNVPQIEDKREIKEKFYEGNKLNESKYDLSTNETKTSSPDSNVKKVTSNTDSESESEYESEDPYSECQAILAHENSKNNISYIFDESNEKELISREKFDFTKCSMKIQINDQIRKIECTEEIGLFQIKPKIETSKSMKQNSSKKKIKSNKIKKELTSNSQPAVENKRINKKSQELSSSTPFPGKIKITHRNKFSNDLENSTIKKISIEKNRSENSNFQDSISYEKHGAASIKTSSQEKLSKQNIRNEDINAVLSHLYGNGK